MAIRADVVPADDQGYRYRFIIIISIVQVNGEDMTARANRIAKGGEMKKEEDERTQVKSGMTRARPFHFIQLGTRLIFLSSR